MKRWYQQLGIGSLFSILLIIITVVLRKTFSEGAGMSVLAAPFHYLYFVPILLAAMLLGETGCVIIALLAAIASSIADNGLHWPSGPAALWSVGIRGAFFLFLGYLAATIADRMRANTRTSLSLLDISRTINSSLDLDEALEEITRKSVEITSADACSIRLLDEDGQELIYAKSHGLSDRYLTKGPQRVENNKQAQQAIKDGVIIKRDVRKEKDAPYRDETLAEGIIYIMGVPLRHGEKVIGLLNLYRKRFARFSSHDFRTARTFAEQAATAIQNARYYTSIQKNYLDTVRALTRAIEAKDNYTLGHSERVAEYAVKMAQQLELPCTEIKTLEFGALLHDLGKISLDEAVLAKTQHLTVDEQMIFEMHPMIGKSILDPVEFLQPAVPIVMYHHERWDGMGYPVGLSAEAIPMQARIVAVANGFDNIMYRSSPFPVSSAEALETIRQAAGTQYDPALVELLATILEKPDEVAARECTTLDH